MTENSNANESNSAPAGDGKEQGKPSLDDLLASYGKGGGQPEESAEALSDKVKTGKGDSDRIAALEQQLAAQEYDAAMGNIIPRFKGDSDLADKYVEFWINDRAAKDERLRTLWDERKANPDAFNGAMDALAAEFAKEHGLGQSDSNDDDRIGNAVRNARNASAKVAGYDNVDWSSLNPEQFELKKRALFKAAERGELRNS